jgi:acetyl/propionyl-CoA carboxylase alpha subunit
LFSATEEPKDHRGGTFPKLSRTTACFIEFQAPAPRLSSDLRTDLSAKAIAAARAVNYVGAGTVEFIFDNDTQEFYFMEM